MGFSDLLLFLVVRVMGLFFLVDVLVLFFGLFCFSSGFRSLERTALRFKQLQAGILGRSSHEPGLGFRGLKR